LRGKNIGGEKIAFKDPPALPQGEAGPYNRLTLFLGKRTACPPDPGNEMCLMVFARNALASGPGNA